MIILLTCVALLVLGVTLQRKSHRHSTAEFLAEGLVLISGSALLIGLIGVPLKRMEVNAEMAEVRAIQATAAAARSEGDSLEGAAWRMRVSDANEWIASTQYWANSPFGLWFPNSVREMEPIS